MKAKYFTFWRIWLMVMGVIWLLLGGGMVVSSLIGLDISYINASFWQTAPQTTDVRNFQGFVYGVYSALIVVTGLAVVFITHNAFKKKERWGWYCMLIMFTVWYLIDSSFSLLYGVYLNAINNSVLFALCIAPLVFTKREFRKTAIERQPEREAGGSDS